jgi:hypothetical protein
METTYRITASGFFFLPDVVPLYDRLQRQMDTRYFRRQFL